MIIEKDAFDNISKFLIENKLTDTIDLAVLGCIRGFHKLKNFAIITEHPSEILEYLDDAGITLPGAMKQLNEKTQNGSRLFRTTSQPNGEFDIPKLGKESFLRTGNSDVFNKSKNTLQ
jgi:hypothetical protein